MDEVLSDRIRSAMLLTDLLAEGLDEAMLTRRNGDTPSATMGSQFWCVVGARESYSAGIAAGRWVGFSCSINRKQAKRPAELQAALDRSRSRVIDTIDRHGEDKGRMALAYDLLEHEALHQGQLIRYFYTNNCAFPEEFAERFALQQPVAAAT